MILTLLPLVNTNGVLGTSSIPGPRGSYFTERLYDWVCNMMQTATKSSFSVGCSGTTEPLPQAVLGS